MKTKEGWIIIPAYNEAKTIPSVIEKVLKKASKNKVVLVDDGSEDNTSEEAEKKGVIVLKHLINLGKGAALKTGCDYALKNGAEKIVVIDADGQHDPSLIPSFIEGLDRHDMVLSYRRMNKNMPFVLRIGNSFLNLFIYVLYGIRVRDSQSGYRSFTSGAYRKIRWAANDYSMESEMIAKIGKHNIRFKEIPIKTVYQDRYKGTTIFDGLKIAFDLLWWKLTRF